VTSRFGRQRGLDASPSVGCGQSVRASPVLARGGLGYPNVQAPSLQQAEADHRHRATCLPPPHPPLLSWGSAWLMVPSDRSCSRRHGTPYVSPDAQVTRSSGRSGHLAGGAAPATSNGRFDEPILPIGQWPYPISEVVVPTPAFGATPAGPLRSRLGATSGCGPVARTPIASMDPQPCLAPAQERHLSRVRWLATKANEVV
jgi:hypothetical protein